jgi:hypothetical protein
MTTEQDAKKRIVTYLIAVFALSTPFYIMNIVALAFARLPLPATGWPVSRTDRRSV